MGSRGNSARESSWRHFPSAPMTPVPYAKIGLLGWILSANNTSIWMIFSFLPFMVEYFYPELSKTELGFRAGILGSAFSAGGLLGNLISGVISDRFGRRPALMWGVFGTALSSLLFGFAPSFWLAVLARFLWGLLNGNIGVAKTYLAEISDDTNMAKGMALFGVIGGVGRIIGPVIGGFLSLPANNYPVFRGTIFEAYPFALPSIVISTNCVIILIVSYFALPETLRSRTEECRDQMSVSTAAYSPLVEASDDNSESSGDEKNSRSQNMIIKNTSSDSDIEMVESRSPTVRFEKYEQARDTSQSLSPNSAPAELGHREGDRLRCNGLGQLKRKTVTFSSVVAVKEIGTNRIEVEKLKQLRTEDIPVLVDSTSQLAVKADGMFSDSDSSVKYYSNGAEFYSSLSRSKNSLLSNLTYLARQRQVATSTALYGLIALAVAMVTETFPLWVVTSRAEGGFGYSARTIGLTSMVGGFFSIVLQLTLYPHMVSILGVLKVHRLGTLFLAVVVFLFPTVSLANYLDSDQLTWTLVVFMQLAQNAFTTWSLISLFVLISNSCYSHQRATVNGIGQTCASLGRLLGPYLAGITFAWSENNGLVWPLNFYCAFYLVSVILVSSFVLSGTLPRSIERRKREPRVRSYVDDDTDAVGTDAATATAATGGKGRAASPRISAGDSNTSLFRFNGKRNAVFRPSAAVTADDTVLQADMMVAKREGAQLRSVPRRGGGRGEGDASVASTAAASSMLVVDIERPAELQSSESGSGGGSDDLRGSRPGQ